MSSVINSLSALKVVIEQMEQIRGSLFLGFYKERITCVLNIALGVSLPSTVENTAYTTPKVSETPGTMYSATGLCFLTH